MWTLGVTMVIQFEENRIRQQEVEVRALAAVLRDAKRMDTKIDAELKLYNIAFPEKLARKINQEKL